jgi:hypothetical protein
VNFSGRLERAYVGELFGETLFSVMAKSTADLTQRSKLTVLARLEARMQLVLRPMMESYEIGVPDRSEHDERAEVAAAALNDEPWEVFLREFEPSTTRTLEGYQRLREAAPDPDDPVLLALVAHEEALREFARAELRGEGHRSLSPVSAFLGGLEAACGCADD